MKKDNRNLFEVFKNATELLDEDVSEVYEAVSNYYIKLKSAEFYDNNGMEYTRFVMVQETIPKIV